MEGDGTGSKTVFMWRQLAP